MTRARIVDWSRHQGQTNLRAAVDEWDLLAVMIRCTIGYSYFDPWYQWTFKQAIEIRDEYAAKGEDFFVAAYHVLHPWNRNPLREAKWFKDNIVVDGVRPDFLVADLELPNTRAGWATVPPSDVGSQIIKLLPAIESETLLEVVVYTGSWWWNGHLGSVTPLGIEQLYPLIEAEYTDMWYHRIGSRDFKDAPKIGVYPKSLGRGWKIEDLLFWQWTSRLRPVGVRSASQDGQVLIGSIAHLKEVIGSTPPGLTDKEKLAILWEVHPELHPPTEA